uniref:hypothetical protein n=1 Tax=Stappia sp. TaxID=1870903 RepID=UPI003BAA5910
MSVVLPIQPDAQGRVRTYTASAGQTEFAVPFPFQDDKDLVVFHKVGGITSELTLAADFTVSGAGTAASGSITLSVGAEAGDLITVVGLATLERVTSIVRQGLQASAAIDAEFDRARIIQQELRRDADRSFKAPFGDAPGDLPPRLIEQSGSSASMPRGSRSQWCPERPTLRPLPIHIRAGTQQTRHGRQRRRLRCELT